MNAERVFSACNLVAVVGWLLLIIFPRWRWPRALICGLVIPVLLACVYLTLIVVYFGSAQGGFSTLAGVAALFRNPWLLLAGWVHYLAFDLFIGSWQVRDARRLGISHWLVIPGLLLTFFFGPIGLLVYLAIRTAKVRGRGDAWTEVLLQ